MIPNFKMKFFYSTGDFAINLMWQLTIFYLLFFYTDIFGLSPSKAGLVFLVSKIWDAITDPVMGYIADNTKSRWGKFRPYILFASPFALIAIIFCFTAPDFGESGKFIWALSTYITFTTLYTILSIPYGALIPTMTQDPDERTSFSSYRFLGANLGALIVAGLTLPLVGLFTDPKIGFTVVVSIFAMVGFIFLLLCFFNTKEIHTIYYPAKHKIKDIFNMLADNKPLHLILFALSTTWIANNMKTITVVYFIKYNLGLEKYFGLILFGVIFQIMLGAFIANFVKDKFEKKDLFIIGTLLYVISDLVVFFITGYQNLLFFSFIASFGFIGFGISIVMSWSILADTIEYGEWKSGIRLEGIINSFHQFLYKLAIGISAWTSGYILETTNYTPNVDIQNPETLNGLFSIGFLIPSISGSIAIFFIYNYKFNRKFFGNIINEIKLRS